MQFLIITALLVWNTVLSFFILHDYRLLLKVLRWSLFLWLFIFGILLSEVLREGLIVNAESSLHWDVQFAWTLWFLLVICSVLDWRFLVPASAFLLWFLSYPEVRTLLDYGLVRLKWVGIVHSPLSWALSRPVVLEFGIRGQSIVGTVVDRVVSPVFGLLKGTVDYAAGWMLWVTDYNLERLRPTARRSWFPFAEHW